MFFYFFIKFLSIKHFIVKIRIQHTWFDLISSFFDWTKHFTHLFWPNIHFFNKSQICPPKFMTQNHYSQDRTKHLMTTFTLFLTYITNFMFRPKMTLEFYDLIRISWYKSQSQGVITHYRKANLHLKNKTLPASQQASPLYASSAHASAHRTARFHPSNFRLRCSSGISAWNTLDNAQFLRMSSISFQ